VAVATIVPVSTEAMQRTTAGNSGQQRAFEAISDGDSRAPDGEGPPARRGASGRLYWRRRRANMAASRARGCDVVVERDGEGFLVASVPALPGCHTQSRSLDDLMERIKEAIELCLEVQGDLTADESTKLR